MLEALGINLAELVFAAINFLILLAILTKFLYRPFLNMLEKRKQTIQAAFDDAAEQNRKADAKMADYRKYIANKEAEGRDIIRKARSRADIQAKAIVDEARDKADAMLKEATEEIEREKAKAMQEIRDDITSLAMLAAGKILEEDIEIGGKEDEIVDQVINEAGAEAWLN